MGLFGTDPVIKDLSNRINELTNQLSSKNLVEELELTEEVVNLKKQVTELEIEKSKKDEEFDRQKREIEHKLGLERKRVEFERQQAVAEAEMKVREGNLDEEKQRVKDQLDFMTARFEKELESMSRMTEKVMNFIPHMNVDHRIREERKQIETTAKDEDE